jgi:cytochrome c553
MRVERRAAFAALLWLVSAGAGAQPADAALCTNCHGPGGNSRDGAVPSIAGQPKLFIENQLVLIREGLRDVPAMAPVMRGLSDAQIVELATHFAAQKVQPPGGAVDDDRRRRGAALSARALCGSCHLPDYRGQNQVPRLAGQQEAYLLATLRMYRDKPAPGRDTAMSAVLYGMSDADLDALAHHFARAVP